MTPSEVEYVRASFSAAFATLSNRELALLAAGPYVDIKDEE